MQIVEIDLDLIVADSEFNCREAKNVTVLETVELAKSIRQLGLQQPVIVRKDMNNPNKYQLIAGYRRTKAYHTLREEDREKYGKIPCSVVVVNDLEAFRINLVENLQRSALSIKEEAHACKRLLQEGMTPDEVAKELGKSRGWLQNRQQLMDLPEDIQDEVVAYNFTQQMITELWRAPSDEVRYAMVIKVKTKRNAGEKITKILKRDRPLDKKLKPNDEEKLEVMEKVSEIFGKYNVVTRAIAWCAGNITDREFYADCEKAAEVLKSKDVVL